MWDLCRFGNIMVGKLIVCIGMFLWVEIFVSVIVFFLDFDVDLWESEIGMNIKLFIVVVFLLNIIIVVNFNIFKDSILIDNGDFEKCNIMVNIISYVDFILILILNWIVGDVGVEII